MDFGRVRTEDANKQNRDRGEEDDLEDRVDRHQYGAVVTIPVSKVVPDQNHGNTTRNPDQNQTLAETFFIR